MLEKKPIILLGAGGHAKVLLSLINALGLTVIGISSPDCTDSSWHGIPILSSDDAIEHYHPLEIVLVNGIGYQDQRCHLFDAFKAKGYSFLTLVHPTAFVDPTASLGEGVQVMAGAVIQANVVIEHNVIINTRASIDHDCIIKQHVHIASGAILCGDVQVDQYTLIGAGTTIARGIHIAQRAVLGIGVSIVRDVAAYSKVLPAQVRIFNEGAVA